MRDDKSVQKKNNYYRLCINRGAEKKQKKSSLSAPWPIHFS